MQFMTRTEAQQEEVNPSFCVSVEELLKELWKAIEHPISEEKRVWTPELWTVAAQKSSREALRLATSRLLRALRSETKSFDDLTWRQLEEVVAEVLRSCGLEVHVVRERPQGGRDIVARGELIPGQEPIDLVKLAVEVKHRALVGRPEVQAALWQNRNFPALLFATSGRFTAGVLAEKALPENRMRLFLKDGEGLGDMIRDHFVRRAWSTTNQPNV
jgi:hypothetical protein